MSEEGEILDILRLGVFLALLQLIATLMVLVMLWRMSQWF